MQRRKPNLPVLVAVLVFHAFIVTLTWRDLSRRQPTEVRGPKPLWRVASAANTLGAIAYWVIGRRRSEPVSA